MAFEIKSSSLPSIDQQFNRIAGIKLIFQVSIIQRISILQQPSKVCSCIESSGCIRTICTNTIQLNKGSNLNMDLKYFASHFQNVLGSAVKYLFNSWIIVYYKMSFYLNVYSVIFCIFSSFRSLWENFCHFGKVFES